MASRGVGESGNLAARAGRWSAQHRKLAIWGWLGLVVLVFAIGSGAGTVTQENAQSGVGESGRASATISGRRRRVCQDESVTRAAIRSTMSNRAHHGEADG